MPLTPSPGNPKITSTPQSIRRETKRSATVFDITNSLDQAHKFSSCFHPEITNASPRQNDVMITHDCCTVFLSAERTFVLQELKQAYGAHTFCDPAFTDTNGMPNFFALARPPPRQAPKEARGEDDREGSDHADCEQRPDEEEVSARMTEAAGDADAFPLHVNDRDDQ